MAQQTLSLKLNPLLRVEGQIPPLPPVHADPNASSPPSVDTAEDARGIVHQPSQASPEQPRPSPQPQLDSSRPDPTLIDLSLHVDDSGGRCPAPLPGVGYAGLAPRQRFRFLNWASTDVTEPIPPAYQQLYCAHLEARLAEGTEMAAAVQIELPRLVQSPAWAGSIALARTQLLAFWVAQDGSGLAAWVATSLRLSELAGIALGLQAQLGHPLEGRQITALSALWPLMPPHTEQLPPEVLSLHLSSLEANLGQRVLTHVLAQMPPTELEPKPWRANHRGLRIAFPQPNLRNRLVPLLRDLYTIPAESVRPAPVTSVAEPENETLPDRGWQLILEFGNSRSEYFDVVMRTAQKLPGYNQLMDENRQLVHRIFFKRSELRRFWRIWDYVQSWSSARVYVNGEELEKWKIWPYSQYLK